MPYFHSGDVRLYYEEHGRGYPVVLAHGMGESTELWSGRVQPLAERYRLILWDNRGHGRSDKPADEAAYGIELFAADLRSRLDHLAVERACVGGRRGTRRGRAPGGSGGYTAIAFALACPERLSALILADTVPGEEN